MRQPTVQFRRRYGPILAIAVALAPAAAASADQPPAKAVDQSSYYTYHKDWAIVSAPPPPGPYQTVNLDPRIPGQEDAMPAYAGAFTAQPAPIGQDSENFLDEPPAAGPPPVGAGPQPGGTAFDDQPPPPGYYSSRGFVRRGSAPVQGYQRPYYGYQRPEAPRYGYEVTPWSNVPVPRTEDEVPPPPVYNRMVSPPPPGYRGGPIPDQGYRRGTGWQ
jgi:hypothetical protein